MLVTTLRFFAIAAAALFVTLDVNPVIARAPQETSDPGAGLKGGSFPEQAARPTLKGAEGLKLRTTNALAKTEKTKSTKGTKKTAKTAESEATEDSGDASSDDDVDDDVDDNVDDDDDTTAESNDRAAENCIDDPSPRPVRKDDDDKATRYRFNMKYADAHCVDEDDNRYQYGQYDEVTEFSDCADKCVYDGSLDLLASLVGYDWDCTHDKCRCLYDKGALGDQNSKDLEEQFAKINEDYDGEGSVSGGKDKKGWYCAKLAQAEEETAEIAVEVSRRRGLRA